MFNAIKYTKDLENAGFSRKQAEATLDMLYDFVESNLATKQDVVDLQHAIKTLEQDLRHTIEALEYKMTVKLGAMLVVAVGVIVTLQKLL